MDYSSMSPAEVRALIREGKITGPTAGMCAGYASGKPGDPAQRSGI